MKTKRCSVCHHRKHLKSFKPKRAQCNSCYNEIRSKGYRGRVNSREQDSSYLNRRPKLKNPYSCQSVLMGSDVVECPRCGAPIERRKLNGHAKEHRR